MGQCHAGCDNVGRFRWSPAVGTFRWWKVDIAKSTFSPGPVPKGPNTQKIEAVENGVKLTADGVNAQGQKTHVEFTVKLDGKDHPFTSLVDGNLLRMLRHDFGERNR